MVQIGETEMGLQGGRLRVWKTFWKGRRDEYKKRVVKRERQNGKTLGWARKA